MIQRSTTGQGWTDVTPAPDPIVSGAFSYDGLDTAIWADQVTRRLYLTTDGGVSWRVVTSLRR